MVLIYKSVWYNLVIMLFLLQSQNRVSLWEYCHAEPNNEPQLICETEVPSDVTNLSFLDERRLVASFSNGCVALFKYQSMRKVSSLLTLIYSNSEYYCNHSNYRTSKNRI